MATKADLERENRKLRRDNQSYQKRQDGWANLLTGLGVSGLDKKMSTTFGQAKKFTEDELNKLYRSEGFAKRLVNIVADEMVREWFHVANDTDNVIVEALNDLKAKTIINRHLRWDRLHGGAATLMLVDDGQTGEDVLSKPLAEDRLKKIVDFRTYDRWAVQWDAADLYDDPANAKFGTPELYQLNPRSGGLAMFKVHESRLLITHGVDITDIERSKNNGWGDSVIQAAYTQLRSLGSVYGSVETILDDFIQAVMSIENLQDLIASGKEDIIKKRLQVLDMSRHLLNTLLIDTREKYEKKASTVTGLDGIIDKFASALSAVSGIPVSLFMGESPKGLNAAGAEATGLRYFYDMVAAAQESKLQPVLERLVYLIQISKEGPTKGKELEDWAIQFNPLWQPTEKEVVEMRKTQAETDKIYESMGTLSAEEIRESRFGGESYSIETNLDDAAYEAEKAEREANAARLQEQLAGGGNNEPDDMDQGD